jgi:xanthine dehydrogenase YagR molybdenum-binding subunit
MTNNLIGQPLPRLEGGLKVTGAARYSAEIALPNLVYAVAVGSTIASGKIRDIDTRAAAKLTGMLGIITHINRPPLNAPGNFGQGASQTEPAQPMSSDVIRHAGQYVAVVIAQSLETAQCAAEILDISYDEQKPTIDISDERAQRYAAKAHLGMPINRSRGDADQAFGSAPVKLDVVYTTPIENHNPMEPHATTAVWDGDKLTVYDSSQYPAGVRTALAGIFALPETNVRVISTYVGGAFGCKGTMWTHVALAALAAKVVQRPVKLVLARKQMFTTVGHRPETHQRLAVGAKEDGTLLAIIHQGQTDTSIEGEYVEQFTVQTPMMYQCPNIRVEQELVRVNRGMPTFMRAPGEATGTYGLECGMDELAHKLGMDPIALRMKNYAHTDPETNLPFSSKSLDKCYELGAEKIGWSKRHAQPGKVMRNGYLVGMGMASAVRAAKHFNAAVAARILRDGTFVVQSSTPEQGTGSITVMTQIAADTLGVPMSAVAFELGDTNFPRAPIAAGSATVLTVGNAVCSAARKLQQELAHRLSLTEGTPLKGGAADDFAFGDGGIYLKSDPARRMSYQQAMKAMDADSVDVIYKTDFNDRAVPFSKWGFGAQFAEVMVDPDLLTVKVSRFVSAVSCGRVMNEKTCIAQLKSGIIWGIGQALLEETITDPRSGRIMNANLAEYRVPVNADMNNLEAYLIAETDEHLGPLGAKGVGEIAMCGVAAAIANAVFNATGKRVRDLPITLDKLLV